jgi:hypothetical protein
MNDSRIDLIHLHAAAPATAREALMQALRPVTGFVRPTLPGVYNGGDLLRKAESLAAAALPDPKAGQPQIAHADSAVYGAGESGGAWNAPGIYRVLLLAVKPATEAGAVERFEREMLAMPRYIRSIKAWRLSRVAQASGARRWTHVWEQRYDDLDGLTGEYMLHPYHWARVDRWFDPEHPDWIVDPHLCHSFCALD